MKILFTGASSFTGYWFVKELASADHEVVMTFRHETDQYDGVRRTRVEMASKAGRPLFSCSFGDEKFMQLIEQGQGWDLLCHHAADVTKYKSADFDVATAVRNNTLNIRPVRARLSEAGCRRIVLTGSVFEGGEGAGSEGLPSFSPYGLSKALTAQVFAYYARVQGVRLGKFVIPNPFGPYEEPRFTSYLLRSWCEGRRPAVNSPEYVRDNIHVSLLAKAYVDFAESMPAAPGFDKASPSGYVESQGSFARRFARNMRARLGLPCQLELKRQTEFSEPRVRINTDPVDGERLGWDETRAWDELAEYYERTLGIETKTGNAVLVKTQVRDS
jgi:UDP-glucose 4-epimerase